MYYTLSAWRLPRVMTWTGTLSPALAGLALAHRSGGRVRPEVSLLLLVSCVLVQAACNTWNDGFDGLRGLDPDKWSETPVRGCGWTSRQVLRLGWLFAALAVLCGTALAVWAGWWVAAAGLFGLVCAYLYSAGPRPLASLGLGELTAAVCMGPVIVSVAFFAVKTSSGAPVAMMPQGAPWAWEKPVLAAVPCSFAIASMIFSNNLRDRNRDGACRITLALKLGEVRGRWALGMLLAGAYLSLLVLMARHAVPFGAGLAGLAVPLAWRQWFAARAGRMQVVMKRAAVHHWVFGLLYALGIWWPMS
ncbi:MAG: prenyltransferase [Alicyclobacillus sp.]|nr:prenyltransferase [Alicyclobacillus sp.]